MRKITIIFLLAISGLFFLGSQSHAVSIWFDSPADFNMLSSTQWRYDFGANGDLPSSSAYVDVLGYGGDLTWDPTDYGIGINDDEITGGTSEALKLKFSLPFQVKKLYLVDLFDEAQGVEQAFYSVDSSVFGPFGPGNFSGDFDLSVYKILEEIKFLADQPEYGRWNDFAVAGFEAAPIPEPGTLFLLGIGLLGIGYFGWKRRYFKD